MTAQTQARGTAEFLLYSEDKLSLKAATLASGENLAAGAVVGAKTKRQAAAPIPTIVGTGTGLMSALSFGPALGFGTYFPEAGGHVAGLFLGTFVNLELALGKRSWLVPELSGFQVVSGEVPVRGAGVNLGASLRFGL